MASSFTRTYHGKPYPAISPTRPSLSAKGKVVLITGAGSGIGASTAVAFAEASAKVLILCGRRFDRLEETRAQIEYQAPEVVVSVYALDISDEPAVTHFFDDIASTVGPIDILVNAAGYFSGSTTVQDSAVSDFWRSFEVQIKGTFLLAQQWLRHRGQANDPVFIVLNSLVAHLPAVGVPKCSAAYGPSKIAQAKLIEWIAKENAGEIRCYAVHPGVVETEMSLRSLQQATDDPEAMRRAMPWDDINLPARFTVWLASPEGASIPSGKFLWVNWDVEELKAEAQNIEKNPMALTMTLNGWPFAASVTTTSNGDSGKEGFW